MRRVSNYLKCTSSESSNTLPAKASTTLEQMTFHDEEGN